MAVIEPNGRPLFGFDDLLKKRNVIARRLCGQCGKPLDNTMAFIGDEDGVRLRVFKEPAMHQACAHFVLSVCPYFTKDQHHPDRVPTDRADAVLIKYGDEKLPPAERWGLYLTRSYRAVVMPTGQTMLRAGEQVGATLWYSHGQALSA